MLALVKVLPLTRMGGPVTLFAVTLFAVTLFAVTLFDRLRRLTTS